MMMMMIMVSKL